MTTAQPRQHTAGVIGRALRFMLGVLLVWMTYVAMRMDDASFNVRVLAAFGALTLFYAILHLVLVKAGTGGHPWLGAALAVTPVILVFALGGPLGRVASVAFVGVSLLLQALRGDGGCEVMALPAIILRKRTHLPCILFSPIDWVEKHLTGPGGLPG